MAYRISRISHPHDWRMADNHLLLNNFMIRHLMYSTSHLSIYVHIYLSTPVKYNRNAVHHIVLSEAQLSILVLPCGTA